MARWPWTNPLLTLGSGPHLCTGTGVGRTQEGFLTLSDTMTLFGLPIRLLSLGHTLQIFRACVPVEWPTVLGGANDIQNGMWARPAPGAARAEACRETQGVSGGPPQGQRGKLGSRQGQSHCSPTGR